LDPPEVRQLVTFKFEPGHTEEAVEIFRSKVIPLYVKTEAMIRFRVSREVESPEPLDLILVATYRSLAGMDRSNAELAQRARESGTSIGALYGSISDLSHHHHDQFVEILPAFSHGDPGSKPLTVFDSIRVIAGGGRELETLLASGVLPWEKGLDSLAGSETARFLIGDGWNYLRILGFENLSHLHDYLTAAREEPWSQEMDRLVATRKRIVVRQEPDLAVR
jgi:quinol monooxygenase YgiN